MHVPSKTSHEPTFRSSFQEYSGTRRKESIEFFFETRVDIKIKE
jgi:hypothetical protein